MPFLRNSKMIHLNVGGEKFTTTIGTLSREPDSMLTRLVSDQWLPPSADQNPLSTRNGENQETNEIFIDRWLS